MNTVLNATYYGLFICFGIILVVFRDGLAAKLAESRRFTDLFINDPKVNRAKEIMYAKFLTVGLGVIFIAFGFFKTFELVTNVLS